MNKVNKRVNLKLVGLNGNAFSLMGAFSNQATREGWNKEEINVVLDEACTGDYSHLLCTLADHCELRDQADYGDDCEDED